MNRTRFNVLLSAGLVVSFLATLVPGLDLSFNVYALSLKNTFNFTQTQVEVSASMVNAGLAFSFLETLITGALGYTGVFLITWVFSSLFSLLQWFASIYPVYFHQLPGLLFLFQFLFAWSNTVTFVVLTRVVIEIFPRKHSGKLVGMYYTMSGMGKILYALMIEALFHYNLSRFFGTITVMCVGLLGTAYLILYKITLENQTFYSTIQHDSSEASDILKPESDGQDDKAYSIKDMGTSLFFHLVLWPSVFYFSCAFTILNNITSIVHSLGNQHPVTVVYVISVSIITTRLLFGFIFDTFRSLYCGFALIFVIYTSLGVSVCLLMVASNQITVYVAAAIAGIGIGPGITIPISMLVLRFGQQLYSVITNLHYTLMSVTTIIIQIMMGLIYDAQINKRDSDVTSCFGQHCFYWSCISFLVLIVTCLVVHLINFTIVFCHECSERKANVSK